MLGTKAERNWGACFVAKVMLSAIIDSYQTHTSRVMIQNIAQSS